MLAVCWMIFAIDAPKRVPNSVSESAHGLAQNGRHSACDKSGIQACETHLTHIANTFFRRADFFGTFFDALFAALIGALSGLVVFQVCEMCLNTVRHLHDVTSLILWVVSRQCTKVASTQHFLLTARVMAVCS